MTKPLPSPAMSYETWKKKSRNTTEFKKNKKQMHSFQRHDISNPVTSKVSYAFDSCSTDQSITLFEGLFKWKKKKKLLKWAKFILWVSFASFGVFKARPSNNCSCLDWHSESLLSCFPHGLKLEAPDGLVRFWSLNLIWSLTCLCLSYCTHTLYNDSSFPTCIIWI